MRGYISSCVLCYAVSIALNAAPSPAPAFELDTHRTLNTTALRASSLNDFLRIQIGLVGGVETEFQHWQETRTASQFIREGGAREDEIGINLLYWRPNRHFHDPLRPWASAGLKGVFDSSVVWMQEDADSLGLWQGYSWAQARHYYLVALTSPYPQVRDEYWADTFQSIGQIMHLIEDAAQPAHVRNDAHPMGAVCRFLGYSCFTNFDYWAEDNPADLPSAGAGGIDSNILRQETGHPEQAVPVARLIDTDTYVCNSPPQLGSACDPNRTVSPSIGIAEFTNANFFSEDTISNDVYPFPSLAPSALVPMALLPYKRLPMEDPLFPRKYYGKAANSGVQLNGPLYAEAVFDEVVNAYGTMPVPKGILDENVWHAEAEILLPKAVDYAQAALDYFFRGKLAISQISDTSSEGNYSQVTLTVENDTDGEATDGTGDAWAVLRYRTAADPTNYAYAVSNKESGIALSSPQEVVFHFPANGRPADGLPADATDIDVTVVWSGRLGFEPVQQRFNPLGDDTLTGAILVGTKHLNCRAVHLDGTQMLVAHWAPADSPQLTMSFWVKLSSSNAGFILDTPQERDDGYTYPPARVFFDDWIYDSIPPELMTWFSIGYSEFDHWWEYWWGPLIRFDNPGDVGSWAHVLIAINIPETALFAVNGIVRPTLYDERSTPHPYIGWNYGTQAFVLFGDHGLLVPDDLWSPSPSFVGDVAEVWMAPGTFLDITNAAIRAKFIDASGKPVDLGAGGAGPLGGEQPAVYLRGSRDTFSTNRGSGGAFVQTGTFTDATTSPCDTTP